MHADQSMAVVVMQDQLSCAVMHWICDVCWWHMLPVTTSATRALLTGQTSETTL